MTPPNSQLCHCNRYRLYFTKNEQELVGRQDLCTNLFNHDMTEFALCTILRTRRERMFLGSCEFQPKSAAFRELARMSPLSKKPARQRNSFHEGLIHLVQDDPFGLQLALVIVACPLTVTPVTVTQYTYTHSDTFLAHIGSSDTKGCH